MRVYKDDDEINFVDEKIEKLIASIKNNNNFSQQNILNVEIAKTLFSIEYLLRLINDRKK